jgi:hypothetical protein
MIARVAFVWAVSLALAACASTPQAPIADPPLATGLSRIYFYRTTFSIGSDSGLLGNVAKPLLTLDGQPVAEATAGSVFFCDVTPGRHQVTVRANQIYSLTVATVPNQANYVKLDWGMLGMTGQSHVSEASAAVGGQEIEGRPRIAATCPQAGG